MNAAPAIVRITRRCRFSAAHRLDTPSLSPERNREVYGKCNNPHGHGHDYTLELSVSGPLDPRTGRLIPIAALDRFIEEVVLARFDRSNLNVEVSEFAAMVPTTENLAQVLARRIALAWPHWFATSPGRFEKLRIWETRRNIFEVLAPQGACPPDSNQESLTDEIIQSRR